MGSLLQNAQTSYSNWKMGKDVSTMNESELSQYNMTVLKFEKAIQDAQALEAKFYEARQEAFASLESEQLAARTALQNTWQAYEDNNMTVV